MDLWRSLDGMIRVRITSADITCALTDLDDWGIPLYHVTKINDLTVESSIRRRNYPAVLKILKHRGDSVETLSRWGLFWRGKSIFRRPVLLVGLLLIIAFSCVLPSRIWFVKVEGNTTVPDNLILEYAANCGISFGASRREVRSEKMKNALLEALPQLQWAGVNTSGCVATISVRERQQVKDTADAHGVSSIVAIRDGLIQSCTVVKGSGVCTVGQAVKAGQVLISGYTDCGLKIHACRAEGEVYARTERDLTIIAPTDYRSKASENREVRKFSLVIGKKRINLFKDSGILEASCDKMVSEKSLTLPGGFVLPIKLVTEVWVYNDEATFEPDAQQLAEQLEAFVFAYLDRQMIAGSVLSSKQTLSQGDGFICLEGKYACYEMIGRVQKEEIMKPDGKYD